MLKRALSARVRRLILGLLFPGMLVVGCGEDELSNEAYGPIDLAPFFYDGSTTANPTLGLPRNLIPRRGWVAGRRAEYYDFGLVTTTRKRNARTGATTTDPDYAVVMPMYFFFKPKLGPNGDVLKGPNGKPEYLPITAPPIKETRTGLWHMRGGKDVLNPNPQAGAKRDIPYPIRIRNILGSYQRPIVSSTPYLSAQYSGLWEVVEVLAPASYEPDSIKHDLTLVDRALKADGWDSHRTGKVINCPLVDDRTYVTPSVFAYKVPRPRMEVWYRTKLGTCYLINGWETLGGEDGKLYNANMDDMRLNTFDVTDYTVGVKGENERRIITAPVGTVYDPMVRLLSQDRTRTALDIRFTHDSLSDGLPRHTIKDPPGYRPIKWHWDIEVAQDPPYRPGTFQSLERLDPAQARGRAGVFTRNFPLIGVALPCNPGTNDLTDPNDSNLNVAMRATAKDPTTGATNCTDLGLECNGEPDAEIGSADPTVVLPAQKALLQQRQEGGPRCDVPRAWYGEFCAPGIARCDFNFAIPKLSTDETKEVDEGKRTPIPSVLGGFACHPNPIGYCHLRCDSEASASGGGSRELTLTVNKEIAGNKVMEEKKGFPFSFDPRCGGDKMLGFACVSPTPAAGYPDIPTRLRVCLRTCSTRNTEAQNDAICNAPVAQIAGGKTADKITLTRESSPFNPVTGTKCLTANGPTACIWDPAYEPRDPKNIPLP